MWWPHDKPSWAWPLAPYTGPPACSSGRLHPSSSPPSGTVPPSGPSSPCIGPPPECSSSHTPHTGTIQQKHINKDKAKTSSRILLWISGFRKCKYKKLNWFWTNFYRLPSLINWTKWLTWALIFSSCSSSIFWVSLSFLVKLVFSSSRCLINFLCSSSFTMKKNHIFVDHSYQKITWFLGVQIIYIFKISTHTTKHIDHQTGDFGLYCTDLWYFDFSRSPCCPWTPAVLGAVSADPPGQSVTWWSSRCRQDFLNEPWGDENSGSETWPDHWWHPPTVNR